MASEATSAAPLLQDAMLKEWLAVQRRYHAQQIASNDTAATTSDKPLTSPASPSSTSCSGSDISSATLQTLQLPLRARCFVSLSDPDLSSSFHGETEIQFTLPATYPTEPPVFDLTHYRSRLSHAQFTALDAAMHARARELRNTLSLRKLLTWLDNNFYPLLQQHGGASADATDALVEPVVTAVNESSDALEAVDAAATATNQTRNPKKTPRLRTPKDPSATPCRFFLRQSCTSGDTCAFSHALVQDAAAKHATSVAPAASHSTPHNTKSSKQRKVKQQAATSLASTDALPSPATKRIVKKTPLKCKFFAVNKCRNGDKCAFVHDPQAPARIAPATPAVEPVTEPVSTPMTDSSSTYPDMSTSSDSNNRSSSWSEAQQRQLDAALKQFPASIATKERWRNIAAAVDDKSLNDCIDRFQLLRQLVRSASPLSPSSLSSPSSTAVDVNTDTAVVPAPEETPETIDANDDAIDLRIIASDKRVAITLEPVARGAQIRLSDLFLHEIGTLVPHRLSLQVQCLQCPLQFDATLALDAPSVQKWCPRCSCLHVVTLRPTLAHLQSDVIAYVDTNENCRVVDVVPSELLASCLGCNADVLFPRVTPTRRAESTCFCCHTKLALLVKRFVVGQVQDATGTTKTKQKSAASTTRKSSNNTKRIVDNFVIGTPLPNRGVCEHYKHSQRWFRFQCCGRAFPCDVCHDASDCAEANMGKIASRMICGLCSKEQSSAIKECACGNEVGRKTVRTAHWEGGLGCRDPTRMANTEKKKFRGLHKTASKKHARVGVAAKAAREHGGGGGGSDA